MKKILFIICLIATFQVGAQKYFTRTGVTELMALVDLYDSIKVYNRSTTVIFNTETKDLSALIFIKAFQFNRAIVENGFNKDLMESDIYPKASFKGKAEDFDFTKFKDRKKYSIHGMLTIKGITKEASTLGTFIKKKDELWLKATFTMNPKDFNIQIPDLIKHRVGRFIDLTVYLKLKEQK